MRRVLVVTTDPGFAISAARMHPDAKVLVASPNQLPDRSVDPFDVAVIDAGVRNAEIADQLTDEGTAGRVLLVTPAGEANAGRPSIARPFTLDDLVSALELDPVDPPRASRDDAGAGFVGRLLSRLRVGDQPSEAPADQPGEALPGRIRAWPRVDREPPGPDPDGFAEAAEALERASERLAATPPVGHVAEEARALATSVRDELEGRSVVVWLEREGRFEGYGADGDPGVRVEQDHPVVSALGEDVSAVLLAPSGPASDLVGGDAPAVVVAGLRHGGRLFGVVALARRGLTVADRDRLLFLARERAPRLALARALRGLREGPSPSPQ